MEKQNHQQFPFPIFQKAAEKFRSTAHYTVCRNRQREKKKPGTLSTTTKWAIGFNFVVVGWSATRRTQTRPSFFLSRGRKKKETKLCTILERIPIRLAFFSFWYVCTIRTIICWYKKAFFFIRSSITIVWVIFRNVGYGVVKSRRFQNEPYN